ncbi:hypothetical protein [Desulfurivibrio sp. C05AmB]|uniref:hypothetical protein n=1 Tax=Desulfurivibrio sp. C05AmB TaxID=3374371 RepID=UPI00376F0294
MKKQIFSGMALLLIIGLAAAWLYSNEQAAKPGGLSSAHAAFTACQTCHVPWRGVDEQRCRQCHFFGQVEDLKPQLRFHEAGKHCLACHREHRGRGGDISRMDHTLLSGELQCTQCHVDRHASRFGNDCRECHGISTWRIEGFRHPADDNRNCHRCHQAPRSHYYDELWENFQKTHLEWRRIETMPPREECWRCHITHRWGHRRMPHDF